MFVCIVHKECIIEWILKLVCPKHFHESTVSLLYIVHRNMRNNNKCWCKAMWMQQLPPEEQCWQFGIFSVTNYMVGLTSTTDGSGCISPGGGCFHPQKYTLYVTAAIDRRMENIVDLV